MTKRLILSECPRSLLGHMGIGTYIHTTDREPSGIHFDRFFQAIDIFLTWEMRFSPNDSINRGPDYLAEK